MANFEKEMQANDCGSQIVAVAYDWHRSCLELRSGRWRSAHEGYLPAAFAD